MINVSSGADGGQFHHKNVMHFFSFVGSWGQLRGKQWSVSSGKSYIHCIYFSLTSMGKLGGSWGLFGFLGGSPGAYRGQLYWEKVMFTAFIFLCILGGLIDIGLGIIIETLACPFYIHKMGIWITQALAEMNLNFLYK